jgi:hypothetical protein
MGLCLGCGQQLLKRHQVRYCSNACQGAAKQRLKVATWLETGIAYPGTRQGHYVRSYLFHAQDGQCALCRLSPEWNGLPLAFVLDHIDGDASNNRRENLRLVCPNCDSQLPTYKSRNRGNGRHWRRVRYADGKSY